MRWEYELVTKRKAQRSTVFIVETLDHIRIRNFTNVNHSQLFGKEFYNIYKYNIQQGTFYVKRDDKWFEEDLDEPPLEYCDKTLRRKTSLLILYYIYTSDQALRLSNYLLSWAMDEGGDIYANNSVIIVFTSSSSLFPETVRKFCYTIQIVASTPDERRTLINKIFQDIEEALTHKYGVEKVKKEYLLKFKEEFVVASAGLDLHMIESATLESIYKERQIKSEYYTRYKIDFLKQYGIEYVEPKYGFEAVGGYHLLKQYIKSRIIKLIKNPKLAEKYSLTPPRGIIMFGLPGVGKSFFAKALAKEIGLPLLKIDPSTFLRGIVGQTETRVKQITNMLETFAPVIVFIDEIDQIAMARGRVMSTDSGVSRRLTNMLLDWLGDRDRKSIVIGATNFISDLDPAFIRPGRIDEVIPILLPDKDARVEIFRIHTSIIRHMPISKDVDFDELADMTYAWTGAEIEKLVVEAGFRALSENTDVSMKHFTDALKTIDVNLSEREKKLRQLLSEANRFENINKSFLKQLVTHYSSRESKAKALVDQLSKALVDQL